MSGNGPIQALLIVLAMACPLGAQIARFQIQDGKLTIEEKSGRRHELPAEKVDEKSLRLSPDGRRLIYHLEFAGYGHDPRIPVKVWSTDRPGHLAEFQVPTYSRYLDFVEWVDARRVLIGGDAYGVVLDVDKGEVERKIRGGLFTISPDRVKVACWKRFGFGTPPIISDRVMIAQLGEREWRAGPEVVQSEPGFYQVYPPDSELKEIEIEGSEDMSRRRYASGSFLWFSDSRRLAFVEVQDRKYWLVTLRIEIRDGVITAGHERMVLPLSTADVPDGMWMAKDLSWRKQDEELSFVIYDRRLVVNVPRKTIRWETARSGGLTLPPSRFADGRPTPACTEGSWVKRGWPVALRRRQITASCARAAARAAGSGLTLSRDFAKSGLAHPAAFLCCEDGYALGVSAPRRASGCVLGLIATSCDRWFPAASLPLWPVCWPVRLTLDQGVNDYFARQVVLERLRDADLPEGVSPQLGPMSTPIGELYRYRLAGAGYRPMQLRELQDWVVAPRFLQVPGVADVTPFGGLIKQYQVQIDPGALIKYGLSIAKVAEAVQANNSNAGGGAARQPPAGDGNSRHRPDPRCQRHRQHRGGLTAILFT